MQDPDVLVPSIDVAKDGVLAWRKSRVKAAGQTMSSDSKLSPTHALEGLALNARNKVLAEDMARDPELVDALCALAEQAAHGRSALRVLAAIARVGGEVPDAAVEPLLNAVSVGLGYNEVHPQVSSALVLQHLVESGGNGARVKVAARFKELWDQSESSTLRARGIVRDALQRAARAAASARVVASAEGCKEAQGSGDYLGVSHPVWLRVYEAAQRPRLLASGEGDELRFSLKEGGVAAAMGLVCALGSIAGARARGATFLPRIVRTVLDKLDFGASFEAHKLLHRAGNRGSMNGRNSVSGGSSARSSSSEGHGSSNGNASGMDTGMGSGSGSRGSGFGGAGRLHPGLSFLLSTAASTGSCAVLFWSVALPLSTASEWHATSDRAHTVGRIAAFSSYLALGIPLCSLAFGATLNPIIPLFALYLPRIALYRGRDSWDHRKDSHRRLGFVVVAL